MRSRNGDPGRGFVARYGRGLRVSARNNATAYGYSVVVTIAFGTLGSTQGTADVYRVFVFAGGAILAFALVETVASGGFRHGLEDEPSEVKALVSSFAFLSVGLSLVVALIVGWLLKGLVAWFFGSFFPTVAYLCLVALEIALAERWSGTSGD